MKKIIFIVSLIVISFLSYVSFASGDYSNGTLVEMLSGVLIDFGNQSYVNPSSVIDLNKTYEVYTDGYGSPSLGDVQI